MNITLRERKIKHGKITLYLDIYHKGKRTLEYLGIYLDGNRESNKEKRKLAEKVRTQREVELQTLGYNFIPDYRKRQNFISYFEAISKEYKSNSTLLGAIEKLKDYKGNLITFEEIDEKWLEDFKKHMLKNIGQNSAALYFQKVKQVIKRAKMEKIISVNPGEFVPNIRMIPAQRTYLELKEIEKLNKAECTDEQVKRAFIFSCFTGLRFSDIKKLTWDEIKTDQIQFQIQKTKAFSYVPLHPTALDILNKQRSVINLNTNRVFTLPEKNWNNRKLKAWCKKAEINKNISFHTARHTFATMSLTYGADIATVSSLLDHKSIKTTQVYAKIIDSKKQSAIDSIPKLQLLS